MTEMEDWQKNNEAYLEAALAWLRLRLERLAGAEQSPVILPEQATAAEFTPATSVAAPQRRSRFFGRRSGDAAPAVAPPAVTPVLLPPAPAQTVTQEQLDAADAALRAFEATDPPPALLILAQRFGLSLFEREVLLLCAAMELDTRVASLAARAQDDAGRPYPTFALALALFDEPAWEALSPERPLRFWRLVEINQPPAQSLVTSALRADERVVNYLKGLNYLDDRLAPYLFPLPAEEFRAFPASHQRAVDAALRALRPADAPPPLVHLHGADPPSKQLVAARASAALGLHLYRLPAELLPAQAAELETLARLWQRESALLPVALYLDAHEADRAAQAEGQAAPVNRFLARTSGVVFLDTRELPAAFARPALTLDAAKPSAAEQRDAWAEETGPADAESPALLAAQFNLSLAAIRRLARGVLSGRPADEATAADVREQLWQACLAYARPQLDLLAQRVEPKAGWDDIVLPPAEKRLLRQIADQVQDRARVYEEGGFGEKMNRGLGISALFAGESGTGKTMAAEVIAAEMRLNLYRIDLSAVVSKYIGETEKNLRQLFDRADDGAAILFFDEADALFGKRSEVKDAHDRYANIEIDYLLQRMESYRGLAVLATNMKSALDAAFLRRLRFVVDFPFPGAAERRGIWERVFPAQTATEDLDFERLAALNLTGGNIHNVALNAAFLAARAGGPVTMQLVMEAARNEYRKMGLPLHEADFRLDKRVREVA